MAANPRPEVRLNPQFQQQLLDAMRAEQVAAIRKRELITWVITPMAVGIVALSVYFMFSDDMLLCVMANIIGAGLFKVLWRANKERINAALGRG